MTENEIKALGSLFGQINQIGIVVRNLEDSIKYYAARPYYGELTLQHEYYDIDPSWIDDPLFGVFAYAGEYTSSVARYEYFSITPLDN